MTSFRSNLCASNTVDVVGTHLACLAHSHTSVNVLLCIWVGAKRWTSLLFENKYC